MAVKIKLKRMGKIRSPHYRIIVADARTKRDGRAIEEIGVYNPKLEPSLIKVDSERAQYWLGVGAQPTEPVLAILKVTGDWQKHKGLPGAEGTLKVAEPARAKREAFDAALAEVHGEPSSSATTAKKKPAKKTAAKTDDKASESKASEGKASEGKASEGKDGKKADSKDGKKADAKKTAAKPDEAKADAVEAKADEAKADAGEVKADAVEAKAADAKADAVEAKVDEAKADAGEVKADTVEAKADDAKTDEAPAAEASADES